MDIPYLSIISIIVVGIMMWIALSSAVGILPISDTGCSNYQYLRSHFTSEGVAIGCEWNGTAWHFNETLVNLTWNKTRDYQI